MGNDFNTPQRDKRRERVKIKYISVDCDDIGWKEILISDKVISIISKFERYILNYIPNQLNWPDVFPIALAAVAGCCLGALIPAIVAAKTKPVDILRYE